MAGTLLIDKPPMARSPSAGSILRLRQLSASITRSSFSIPIYESTLIAKIASSLVRSAVTIARSLVLCFGSKAERTREIFSTVTGEIDDEDEVALLPRELPWWEASEA